MTCLLKCDSGKPRSEPTQAGAGLETVGETIPVFNSSKEILVHVVLCPGIWYKEVKISGLSEKMIIYNNKITVKPVLSGHSKIDKTKILMTNGSLMKVKSISEYSPWSILQYFDLH